ncbi:MAG: DUF4236 domain-containing protein [Vicinamibacteria bacterium]
MGLRFRKRIRLGPVNVNLSRSGVGYSVGAFGTRVGKSATGRKYATTDLPLGMRYDHELKQDPKPAALIGGQTEQNGPSPEAIQTTATVLSVFARVLGALSGRR